ncbi:MAG: hypothetical protein IJ048_07385, partial [Clostridia bacterium]|nr:hypothetical protein [Clostridia bacterium]
LESRGGRIQTGVLFPLLNRLPEYQVDKKGSGKKPLNYLTSTFGDAFGFEDSADGNSWVSLPSAAPQPAEPEEEAAPVEAESIEAPVPEPAPAQETAEEAPAGADPLALLVAAGLTEEVAQQIAVIFTESANQRAAYNRLRTTFGNTAGREYYQLVKEIAGRQ